WDEFRARLCKLLDVLRNIYKPSYFTRLGLRYTDSIRRSKFDLENVPWHELIRPHVAGILSASALSETEVAGYRGSFQYRISDSIRAQAQFGIVEAQEGAETEFLIDIDFFSEIRIEATTDGAIRTLVEFRPHPFNLFRW